MIILDSVFASVPSRYLPTRKEKGKSRIIVLSTPAADCDASTFLTSRAMESNTLLCTAISSPKALCAAT